MVNSFSHIDGFLASYVIPVPIFTNNTRSTGKTPKYQKGHKMLIGYRFGRMMCLIDSIAKLK